MVLIPFEDSMGLLYCKKIRSVSFEGLYRSNEKWVLRLLAQITSENVNQLVFRCYPLKFEQSLDLQQLDEILSHYPFRSLKEISFTFPSVHSYRRKELCRIIYGGLVRTMNRGVLRVSFS